MLAYLGLEYSEAKVSRLLGSQEFGTPSFAVRRLIALGFQVTYREWSISQLLTSLDVEQPVILFVRTGFLDYWQEDVAHAVVVVGAKEDRQFWLHDPALPTGPTVVSWNGLNSGIAPPLYRLRRLRTTIRRATDESVARITVGA